MNLRLQHLQSCWFYCGLQLALVKTAADPSVPCFLVPWSSPTELVGWLQHAYWIPQPPFRSADWRRMTMMKTLLHPNQRINLRRGLYLLEKLRRWKPLAQSIVLLTLHINASPSLESLLKRFCFRRFLIPSRIESQMYFSPGASSTHSCKICNRCPLNPAPKSSFCR